MSDQLFLYMASSIEVQMEIDACGLQASVPQAVSDMGDVLASIKQIHSPGVAEGVNRIDVL